MDAAIMGKHLDINKLEEVRQAISMNSRFRPGLASKSVNEVRMFIAKSIKAGNQFNSEKDEFNQYMAEFRNHLLKLCVFTNENLVDKLHDFAVKRKITSKRDDYVSQATVARLFRDWSLETCSIISKLFNNLPATLV